MRRRRSGERGIALLTTLLVLVLVVALANEIFRLGARAAQTSAYGRDSVRSTLLAEAGTGALRVALREDARAAPDFDTLDEFWARPTPPFEMGDGTITIVVEDEERKINLNRIVGQNGVAPDDYWYPVFQALLRELGIDPSLADAFVDWLDKDDTPRVGGAESGYYLSLPRPYKAKNDLFDSLDEILLVRGVTQEIYEKIRPFVTVTSSGQVNINTAPAEVIMALSSGKKISEEAGAIDNAAATQLIEYRKEHPFHKASDIGNVSPFFRNLYVQTRFRDYVTVKSSYFHVRSSGDVGGTIRTIDAIGFRQGNDVKWHFWRLE